MAIKNDRMAHIIKRALFCTSMKIEVDLINAPVMTTRNHKYPLWNITGADGLPSDHAARLTSGPVSGYDGCTGHKSPCSRHGIQVSKV